MVTRTATCACERLRVTCAGDPVKISLCHCLDCQKRTGSTYGVAAFFSRKDVEANGVFRTYRRDSDSGFAVNFHFCSLRLYSILGTGAATRCGCRCRGFVRRPHIPCAVAIRLQRAPSRLGAIFKLRHTAHLRQIVGRRARRLCMQQPA